MNIVSKMSVKTKITVIPAVTVISFLMVLFVIYSINVENTKRLNEVEDVYFPLVQTSKTNLYRISRLEELFNTAVSIGEEEPLQKAEETYKQIIADIDLQEKKWPDKSVLIQQTRKAIDEYYKKAAYVSQGMVEGKIEMANIASEVKGMQDLLKVTQEEFSLIGAAALKAFEETIAESNTASQEVFTVTLITAGISIFLIILISGSVIMLVTRNISLVRDSLKDIAEGEGDLTKRIEQKTKDEIGELIYWFNVFMNKLHKTISEIVKSFEPLASLSGDLSEMTSKTSEIAFEQKAATDKISNDIDHMLSNVKSIAENALSAAEETNSANEESKSGSEIVNSTVHTINSLANDVEQASEVITKLENYTVNVGSILDVIKGIAEQTNLLALNAAIEAARAGEQGRGFAVVADEVRTLASKTQESTKEIQSVIEELQGASKRAVNAMVDSQGQASESVQMAAKTGASLNTIAEKVEMIAEMNAAIASATEAQQQVSSSIKENIVGIKNNAESASETVNMVDETAHSLQEISRKLKEVTDQFKL